MSLSNRKPHVEAAIAIVVRPSDRRVLVAQRKSDDDALAGYWEFPGGKCEDGETLEQCLHRELREEVDIVATPLRRLPPIEHDYPAVFVRLHPFICRHESGEPKRIECQAVRWIDARDLPNHEFPPANDVLFAQVIEALACERFAAQLEAAPAHAVDFEANRP